MYSLALVSERPSARTVKSVVATACCSADARAGRRLCQAGPHGLDLEVRVEVGVTHLAAEPGGLVAAEGRRRVAGAPDVDVDGTGLEHRGEPVGVRHVARPHAC